MTEFSPFDAPVKEPHQGKDPSGIKMEKISDAELDGNKGKVDVPKDAPVFEIPQFDEIPETNMGGGNFAADPFAPGSSDDNGGKNTSGNKSSDNGGETKVDSAFAKEFSDYTAKWLVDIFFRLVLAAFRKFAQIDKSEIVKAIEQGFIDERFLKFIDEANDNVEKSINVTEDEKKFVIEPLKYFLEVKKVQLKPEWMFLVGLLMVTGGLFIKAMDIKKDNKALLDKIIKESAEIKAQKSGGSQGGGSSSKKTPDTYENIEDFTDPKAGGFGFTPPKTDSNIEIIENPEVIEPNED